VHKNKKKLPRATASVKEMCIPQMHKMCIYAPDATSWQQLTTSHRDDCMFV